MKTKELNNPWIAWTGGECPVTLGQAIEVLHRDGVVYTPKEAANMRWYHINLAGDIVAYRLASTEPVEASTSSIQQELTDAIDNLDRLSEATMQANVRLTKALNAYLED